MIATIILQAYFSQPEGVPGGEGNFNNRAASITLQVVPPRTFQVYERLGEKGEGETDIVENPCWIAVRQAIDSWQKYIK